MRSEPRLSQIWERRCLRERASASAPGLGGGLVAALGDMDEVDDIRWIDALITSGNGRVLAAPSVAMSKSWLTIEPRGRVAAFAGGEIMGQMTGASLRASTNK
ncbi:hypothetical protein F0562_001866 [Nyssa sinensis]|uniref:Uncharacterized protein n=1 Tax=Nyssa sinensis TaxID=561372 RepID=A0A5J5C885_9ASTE|nr:hypothetical protein F0562_001866 [Nyssa sinensis]